MFYIWPLPMNKSKIISLKYFLPGAKAIAQRLWHLPCTLPTGVPSVFHMVPQAHQERPPREDPEVICECFEGVTPKQNNSLLSAFIISKTVGNSNCYSSRSKTNIPPSFFILLVFGPYPAVLSSYSLLCTQKSLPAG